MIEVEIAEKYMAVRIVSGQRYVVETSKGFAWDLPNREAAEKAIEDFGRTCVKYAMASKYEVIKYVAEDPIKYAAYEGIMFGG